jgi:hypothetical protein
MQPLSRLTQAMRTGEEEIDRLAERTINGRQSTSLLYPTLLIAGGVAAALLVAQYVRSRSQKRMSATQSAPDDFREPISVRGGGVGRASGTTQSAEDWVPERTEYFANDTASTEPPSSFSSDNPDIPTLHPERDGVDLGSSPEQRKA